MTTNKKQIAMNFVLTEIDIKFPEHRKRVLSNWGELEI